MQGIQGDRGAPGFNGSKGEAGTVGPVVSLIVYDVSSKLSLYGLKLKCFWL